MSEQSKYQLRQVFKKARRAIPASYREKAAQAAVPYFINTPQFKKSQHIACYLSYNDEFDTNPLIEAIWQAKKTCYLPVLAKDEKHLYFVRYLYGDALHANQFSILEPVKHTHKMTPNHLDIVITPLLAFDRSGHRLGTGGGYYDRTFESLEVNAQRPFMLGLAFAIQEAPILPFDPWDITLQAIITEKTLIVCS